MNCWLNAEFSELWRGQCPFTALSSLQLEPVYRSKNRLTSCFVHRGEEYYLKYHAQPGWRQLNYFNYPSAYREFHALRFIRHLGVVAPEPVAVAVRGLPAFTRESFLVTRKLSLGPSLAELLTERSRPSSDYRSSSFALYLQQFAQLIHFLHEHGVYCRELSLGQVFVNPRWEGSPRSRLAILDFHRATVCRSRTKEKYIKDFSSLYYSTLKSAAGEYLQKRDILRFIKAYSGNSLRQTLSSYRGLMNAVERQVERRLTRHRKRLGEQR